MKSGRRMAHDIELGEAFHRIDARRTMNLGEQPNGALARSALGRIMDLRLERGDRKGAADVAREYLRRFPSGSRAAGAKALLAAPGEVAGPRSAR